MRIEKIGNVRLRRDDDGETIIINNHNVEESLLYVNQFHIKRVMVEEEYEQQDVDFLSKCPDLEYLSIASHFIKDLSGVYQLKSLKILALNNIRTSMELDFGKLATLEELFGHLPPKAKGLGLLKNLKEMQIWRYKPKSKNLEEFTNLKNLTSLELIQSNIHSLKGVEGLAKLNTLGLYYLRSLKDIEDIKFLSGLHDLKIQNCKAIPNYEPVGQLEFLKELKMQDCGEILSINFVRHLAHLNTFVFDGTTILDGDLSSCEGIEYVYFTQKKHYSHRLKNTTVEKVKERGTKSDIKEQLPTVAWRSRMAEGDDLFTEESIAASEKALLNFVSGIKSLDNPTGKEILEKVKEVILEFNRLNEEYDYFIETMEREELYEFIDDAAHKAGLETDDDITEEWREW